MTEHAIVVQLWDGPETFRVSGEPPSQATLDEIADAYTARNCGVRPSVRVLEHLALPAYVNMPEPTCEELEAGRGPGR
jgi:hypothetical protein